MAAGADVRIIRLEAGLGFPLIVQSFNVSELELWLLVEALLRVVRILVRGEEAEFEVDQEVEELFWDNNAELDMATPPHLRTSSLS